MAKKSKNQINKRDEAKIYAFLATFFTIIGFIIALILKKQDKYVMFYAKQGLVLFIAQVLIIFLAPFLLFLEPILWLFWIILWILSWIYAISGKQKKVFLIGDLAKKIRL